jgi:branched-chain amino acid transport system substrate-binding protein
VFREDQMRLGYALAVLLTAAVGTPLAAIAAAPITIGFPIPLSGATALYGQPVLQGAELAVSQINATGGVLGRKLELLPRDSKGDADEAVRLARELIIKDGVDFLVGTLTSAEAPAVSTVAKENKIVFIAPTSETTRLTDPQHIHPYIFRATSNTTVEGLASAQLMARWKNVKTIATIAPDYAYGRDVVAAFVKYIKELRPDIKIVDQEWPKLGQPDFTPFITAQMSSKPDAVYCALYAGDFVTFAKEAHPLGFFRAIDNRFIDSGAVGSTDVAKALGNGYPYGILVNTFDPVIWTGSPEPPAHRQYIAALKAFTHQQVPSALSIQGYIGIEALADGIRKADSTDSDKVAKALTGMTFETPIGERRFSVASHETLSPEFWGVMVKEATYPFAVMKDPKLLPTKAQLIAALGENPFASTAKNVN